MYPLFGLLFSAASLPRPALGLCRSDLLEGRVPTSVLMFDAPRLVEGERRDGDEDFCLNGGCQIY